jgi:hypothetical protein
MRTILCAVWLVGVAACDEDEATLEPADPDALELGGPQLYELCGDVVCQGWTNKGLKKCGSRMLGDPCKPSQIGLECDPGDACNTTLMCSDVDPAPGPCPISRRAAKKDIAYADAMDLERLHDELLDVRLATYRYNQEPATGKTHLGFLIDDSPASPAVASNGEQVDLYAYASMAVAALQVQQRQIDALTREVEALRAEAASR